MLAVRLLTVASLVATLILPVAAWSADDPVVKHEDTPAPKAGPTVAAAEGFCGEPSGSADELIKRYTAKEGLKKVDESKDYITFSDDPKNATVMYNITTAANPAHPAVVCRKLVKEGDQMTLKYNVVCGGAEAACAKLTSDFNVLIARMQAEVDRQVQGK